MKTCNLCKRTKPLSEFRKASQLKCGYRGRCKSCERVYDRKKRDRRPKQLPRTKKINDLYRSVGWT